ncbi:MAG TPA: sortase [Candidatus Saccharimonadales bacterium]
MLHIRRDNRFPVKSAVITIIALALLAAGGYILLLAMTPKLSIFYPSQPMDVSALEAPKPTDNRIIIPSINVNIPYGDDGEAALDRGAWWRHPDRGNPEKGGNFIIAAHRFSIQPTPQATVEKSPFYHLDKVKEGDPIIVDFNGKRYGYKVSKQYTVAPNQTEIEAESEEPKLTLYSCELGGADAGRVVFEAKPVGEVTTEEAENTTDAL